MQKKKSTLFYVGILAGLGVVIYWIVKKGIGLQNPALTAQQLEAEKKSAGVSHLKVFSESFQHNLAEPLTVLLLQIIIIMAFARLFGFLFKKIGQPAVIGEIVAG
ncbi:MAG TPA: cation/H(+) antiporter, partial [Ferruginibacter sp.]|nr:cation/H(+) antiporter [Ferruginibacter sp.]